MVSKYSKNQKLAIFVAYVLGYLGLQVLLLGIYAAISGDLTEEALYGPGVVISAISGLVSFVALVFIARKNIWDDTLGFRSKRNLKLAFGGVALMYALNLGLGLLYEALGIVGDSLNQEALEGMISDNPWIMAIPVAILIPVVEEILFRGVILEFFEKRMGTWVSILITGILFGLMHTADISSMVFLPIYASMGFVLGWIYIKSDKNILVPIVAHIINNSFAVVAMLFM